MKRSEIPFAALRSFEVAGRHLNLGKAALELGVSRAAISYQISLLEKELELTLFHRIRTGLRLTESGSRLLSLLTRIFDEVTDELDKFKYGSNKEIISLGVPEDIFHGFFEGLILEAIEALPSVHLNISCIHNSDDRDYANLDYIAKWYSANSGFGPNTTFLLFKSLTPLCSPTLAKTINNIEDISSKVLLPSEVEQDWIRWSDLAGIKLGRFASINANSPMFLAGMAARGLGVALLSSRLFEDWIEQQRLVQPIPLEIPAGSYRLERCKHQALSTGMRDFEAWIAEVSQRSQL